MFHIRPLVALILVLVTTLLVSCSGGKVATPPPTYTAEQIAKIEKFVAPIESARAEMTRLEDYINEEDWVNTRSFIHGPLGDLRRDMGYLSRELLPRQQKQATKLIRDLFSDLEELDAEAKAESYSLVVQRYNDAIRDFDAFLDLIPEAEATS